MTRCRDARMLPLGDGSEGKGDTHDQGRVVAEHGRHAHEARRRIARHGGRRRRGPGAAVRRRRGRPRRGSWRRRGRRQAAVLRLRRPAPGRGREVRRPGRRARLPRTAPPRREGVGERPADPGAAEHRRRLVHARHRRVARRRRLDEQHVPRQRPADGQQHVRARLAERAAGRDARPVGRARRQEGRADRVGRRPRRGDPGTDARLPQLPLGPRRRHQLHRAHRRRRVHRGVRPAVRPSAGLRRPGSVPAGRARERDGLDQRAGVVQPGEGDAPPRARRPDDRHVRRQVRPERLPLRQPRRRAHALRPRPLLSDEGRRRRGRRPARGRVGRREGQDPGQRSRRQDRLVPRQGRAALGRPLAGALVPYVGDARDRDLADVAGRAGLHRDVRGLRRRALPVLPGGRLRGAGGRHRERGHLHRAGRVLGDRLPPADQVRARHLQAGPGAGGLPRDRRGAAPVPRARHQAAAERRAQPGVRRRPGERHAGRPRAAAQGLHPRRIRGLRRHDAARAAPHARPRPDDVRLVRPRLRRRSSRRSTRARCSSTSACCRRPQTSQLPHGDR